ncbi:MAG: nicotinate (nicotinamide) nucleotide adenylyltransferase [Planctomycetota bacterium]
MPTAAKRIGIYGGSFDPVHLGHLIAAEAFAETLSLDAVHLIPTAVSPLKPGGPVASDEQRLEMLRMAAGGLQHLIVDDREIRRGGSSYTVDTLASFHQSGEPSEDGNGETMSDDVELFLLVGADSLVTFSQWKEPEKILRLATLAVANRGGHAPIDYDYLKPHTDAETLQRITQHQIDMPQIDISSSDLRDRIAKKHSIRFRVPAAVRSMIANEGMYDG